MKQWVIPATILILGLLSLLTLSSIAPSLAPKQLVFFILGFLFFLLFSKIPFLQLQKISTIGYIGTILLLVITLLVGNITKGSTRWIDVGGIFSIQGSQIAITSVAIFALTLLKKKPLTKFFNILIFLLIVAIPGLLIFIEPDLGTTIVYLFSLSTILFLSKPKISHILPLIIIGIVCIVIAWMFILQPYQKNRVLSFVSPDDSLGTGYNARQSLIAVGSGKFIGRGLGQGIQSHLRFLPERQTDFIFASFAEEFGFIGSLLVIILYTSLINSTLNTAKNSGSPEKSLFCYVTAMMIIFQTGVNIGMNVGIVPITGVTLPFLSYGGSSIITLLIMFGIVQNIRLSQKQKVTLHLE